MRAVRAITALVLVTGFGTFFCGGAAAQLPTAQKSSAQPAQKSSSQDGDPLNRDSPQSAVVSFLEACRAKDYAKASHYLDLRKLAQEQRAKQGPALAEQLERILDRDPGFDVASLSREKEGDTSDGALNTDAIDTFTIDGRSQPLTLERITLKSGLQVWMFAAGAVSLIPKLAAMSTGSPIEKYLPPPLVNWTLMDTSLWRWIAMILLAAVLALFSRWIARLALLVAHGLISRTQLRADEEVVRSFAGPFQLLLPVILFRASFTALGLSALLRLTMQRVCELLLAFGVAWLFFRLVDAGIAGLRAYLTARKRQLPYSTMSLVSRLVKLAVIVFALTTLLSQWGYNTSTILAGLGVGGIAIALAAQKTIENLFGGVAVISDRPVRVGDYCKFGSNEGTVEDIGLRSTRLRTGDRTLVTVPNGVFSAMTIENFNRRDKMLFHITLNLRRDTTPDQVRKVLDSVGQTLKQHPKIEQGGIPIRFTGIGTYSLDLEVFVYVLTTDGDEFVRIQQELLLTILDEVAAAGTALALPTQASVVYSPIERQPAAERGEPEPSHLSSQNSSVQNGRH